MVAPPKLITIQFLRWVASRPRTYAEVREAWQSTCPLTCAWEDAISDGLVRLESGDGAAGRTPVILTPRGRALVETSDRPAGPAISLDPPRPSR